MLKIIVSLIVLLIISCFYTYLGYLVAEERFKRDIEKLNSTITSLNEYIHFLQIELVSERRSRINVTIKDSKEDDIHEN